MTAPWDWLGGHAGVHDLAADISGDPNLVDLDAVHRVDGDVGHLGEVAAVRILERDAEPTALRQRGTLVPAGSLGDGLEHAERTGVVEAVRPFGRRWQLGRVEEVDPELHRILPRGVGELVDERLKHPE